MTDKQNISSEEAELLSQEEDLLSKKEEQGENLDSKEEETLGKIKDLKEELKTRFVEKEIPQKTKEEILSLQAQKEHFRKKFKKEKEEKEKLLEGRGDKEKKDDKEEKEEEKKEEKKTDWQSKVDFLLANKDVTKTEFELISTMAKGKGISLEEAGKDKEIQEYIKFQREKVEKDKENLEPSTKISPSKKALDKITSEEVQNMTLAEKEEYFKKRGMM